MIFWRGAKFMRMPIFGYVVVVGAMLFGAIAMVSSELESKPVAVSQTVGVPAPFKAPLETTADVSVR
jgi:uncharacterized membrane protein YhhN